jgi:hypothetical protein
MDQGDEKQSKQRRDKEPDPEIHDRFDHDTTLWARRRALHYHAEAAPYLLEEPLA